MRTVAIAALLLSLAACEEPRPNADRATAAQTERLMQEANAQAGLPAISNYTEKKFAKMIYELRDQEITTYTYTVNMNGDRRLLCESVGYGLPYTVQYSNPTRTVRTTSYGVEQLPQPEPNGLFMPDGLGPTWVLCSDGKGGVRPVYAEPELLVSPFPLD